MRGQHGQERLRRALRALRTFAAFFLIMCFTITCCMILFLNTLSEATGLVLTQEDIQAAAVNTFLNVILLSLICALIDMVRRHLFVARPVRHIVSAAKKVMDGDLSVRVEPVHHNDPDDDFNTVILYFNQMVEELSKMETLRTDFISNVSHEFKTPLSVIKNYGTMLQQPGLPEEERMEYARAITDASSRLADMTSNILMLNKLENQNLYPYTKTYDLGEQLCECILNHERAWENKALDIIAQIDENVYVKADPQLLSIVWNNLLSNAIKFTEPGGKVNISLKTQGNMAVVNVTDTGCGIPSEVGMHIFEKFYQGDTSHAAQGNGLGLALVKRVIDIMGGEISVNSQVGKGSKFTVKLRMKMDGEG